MDLRMNVPPQPDAAAFTDRLRSAFVAMQGREDVADLLSYGESAGRMEDRRAGAAWLRPLLGAKNAQDVLVCAGGASLLVALVTTFVGPGECIVTEALTYPGIRAVCRHFGVPLFGVRIDEEGIVPAALADACRRHRPKALYCTPTIHNPTTATMSPDRRRAIAEIATQYDLTVFEDDAYGLLPHERLPPLASFIGERTYYMSSLSKCVAPGLRIAFCSGPEAGRAALTEGIRVITLLAPPLQAAVASQWIDDGSAAAILDDVRAECAARQAIARQVLEGEIIHAHPAGPHLWLALPGEWRVAEFGASLRKQGVAAKGDGFAVDGVHPNALRIGLGAPRTRDELIQGLQVLGAAMRDQSMRIG